MEKNLRGSVYIYIYVEIGSKVAMTKAKGYSVNRKLVDRQALGQC